MIHQFLFGVVTVSLLLSACGSDLSNTGSTSARVGASAANTSNPFPGYQSTLYTGTSNWLCHPDLMGTSNVCNGNFDSTAVAADASATTLSYAPATAPQVDCFYVYPTTSIDLMGNSDLNDDLQEQQTTALQFGRYGEVCRQFAPVYRQRTLTALGLTTFTGALGGIDIAPNAGEVAYVTYRAGDPQLEDPRFGLSAEEGQQALCTNPAALAGGPADLFPIVPRQQPPVFRVLLIPRGPGGPYANPISNLTIPTPYYSMPGQVKGQCKVGPNGVSYLEASIVADPDDPRADDYPGEFIGGSNWGLHLIDVSIVQGDLIRLAQRQAASYLRQ